MSSPKKLNSYQSAIKKHKSEISLLAAQKGINFMSAASLLLKKGKSPQKTDKKTCKKLGRVSVKSHKSPSGKRVKKLCRKSPNKSSASPLRKSRSRK